MTTEQKLLSVVVPIYNREKTLPDLMEPLLATNSDKMEILLVNDGSTDASLSLCNDYSKRDARVKVIDKENGGVSSARNAGIDASKGKFLAFFDSDDLIFTGTLEHALEFLLTCEQDLVLFDFLFQNLPLNAERKSRFVLPHDHVLKKDEIVEKMMRPLLLTRGNDFESACTKFFSAARVKENSIRFMETLYIGEDWRFVLDFLDVCESAIYLPEMLYIYRLDGSQVREKYKLLPGLNMLHAYRLRFDLCEKYGLEMSKEERATQSKGMMRAVAYSSNRCQKKEFGAMLKDPLIQSAARFLLSLGKEARTKNDVGKRYRLYARLTRLRAKFFLRKLAEWLTK